MTEVNEQRFFHINRPDQFVQRSLMEVGDEIIFGETSNTLYGFLETHTRSYKYDFPGKEISNFGSVNFLGLVARGEIAPPSDVHVFAYEVACHYRVLVRELIFEAVRKREFSELPSRNTCIWLTDTLEEARDWLPRMGSPSRYQIVELLASGVIHRGDESHLDMDLQPIPQINEKAQKYWSGDVIDKSRIEVIFTGTVRITAKHDDVHP